jgi:hypothetical protein
MKLLNRLLDRLQATFPPNRIVVLLTPIIFVPAAGWAAAWLAKHVPGLNVSPGEIAAFVGAAALAALTLAYKWLDGWQHHEHQNFIKDLEGTAEDFVDEQVAEHFDPPGRVADQGEQGFPRKKR